MTINKYITNIKVVKPKTANAQVEILSKVMEVLA